jgi:hypothetical protein
MDTKTMLRILELRALFCRGLYMLMTDEERRYFWAREVSAVLLDYTTTNDPAGDGR